MRAEPVREGVLVIASARDENRGRWLQGLEKAPSLHEVTDRRTLAQAMAKLRPVVLVVDLLLPGLRGVRGLRSIQRLSPLTRIIALTDAPSEREGVLALKSGARGYCPRSIDPLSLERAVLAVQAGEIWAPRRLVPQLVDELVALTDRKEGPPPKRDGRLGCLTERQRVVADLIGRGASNKAVANHLSISERTVKAHLTEAFRKVGVSDRLQLALMLQGHSGKSR